MSAMCWLEACFFRFRLRDSPVEFRSLPIQVGDLPIQVLFGGGMSGFGFNQLVRKYQRRGLAGFEPVGKGDQASLQAATSVWAEDSRFEALVMASASFSCCASSFRLLTKSDTASREAEQSKNYS